MDTSVDTSGRFTRGEESLAVACGCQSLSQAGLLRDRGAGRDDVKPVHVAVLAAWEVATDRHGRDEFKFRREGRTCRASTGDLVIRPVYGWPDHEPIVRLYCFE